MAGRFKLKAQLYSGDAIAIGPGKADLLGAIDETGSISAAARKLGMSYRRGWLLVDTMNRCWSTPLVETVVGGRKGAALSDLGRQVLADYRALEEQLTEIEKGSAAVRLRKALGATPPT
ncbi:winged helix-turn-helix domain-containing protein [Novosphingopyxis sp.]|uniref:winged helix-turn-helix domain-containing protein n=1 Tax=Novosphingopyxis sp. TaxID=2709690 RepID=UPI003B5A9EC2